MTRKPRSFYLRTGDLLLQFQTTKERSRFASTMGGTPLTAIDARTMFGIRKSEPDPTLTKKYNEAGYFVLNVWRMQ